MAIDTSAHPSGSPTYPLDVFAAISADRKKVAISVVNPTETQQACDLVLRGVRAGGPVRVFRLTAPAATASAPAGPPGMGRFGGAPASVAESTMAEAPRVVVVPAASMTVYEFQVR